MTKDELMKDSESFKNKNGFGYIHGELKNGCECSLFMSGDRDAVEAISYELINKLAEQLGIPLELFLTKMMFVHCRNSEEVPDDTDTLEIE